MEDKQLKAVITEETGRIDKVIVQLWPEYSRSKVQHWLKKQVVEVNGQVVKSNYKVQPQDEIVIQIPVATALELVPENIPLEIVYEDQDLLVVNKPQGMVVHPSAGHSQGTLVNALLYHVKDLSTINDVVRPGIVHRIDKDTSGLLMVAKRDEAHLSLAKQLKDKTTTRKYIALVHGVIPQEKGSINAPIARTKVNRQPQAVDEFCKLVVTLFTVLERFKSFTLVECQLETGRTHQIRVHMKYIGYPLAGDPVYGPRKTLPGTGQFLHAQVLGFTHPTTGEYMEFSAPLPENFQETLASLEK